MSQIAFRSALVAVAFAGLVDLQPADAAPIYKTWVSRNGDDTRACTETEPCRTLRGAHENTIEGGLISCQDSGDFTGSLVITKSVTIDCTGHRAVHFHNGSGDAVQINAPGKVVVLRAIDFTPPNAQGTSGGVNIAAAKTVIIDNCSIRGFTRGIYDHRNTAGNLVVQDSVIENNVFFPSSGGGITIVPDAGGSVRATLNRVSVAGNSFGIAVDGSNSTAGINVTITDSVTANNTQDGIVATTAAGKSPVGVYVKNTRSSNNAIGIRSIGNTVTVRVDSSSVIGNNTGLSAIAGGSLLTYGNNAVNANGSDGAFSGSVALQ